MKVFGLQPLFQKGLAGLGAAPRLKQTGLSQMHQKVHERRLLLYMEVKTDLGKKKPLKMRQKTEQQKSECEKLAFFNGIVF